MFCIFFVRYNIEKVSACGFYLRRKKVFLEENRKNFRQIKTRVLIFLKLENFNIKERS